ncbi:alpha/beta fold hydrolase [Microbacterium limosum]|uniref:Alpha/beta fold hydrolase n=1 Tax=Microbacterium limosum TaxID=3079935 RepID=A0AAU0MJW3_9MICO|nr:alpha/beta fold hydrolase [Microbacterium sp. Y20]WOQ70037.1 alpha/beta fold hydrolase [Microbacterium sp. Y20]
MASDIEPLERMVEEIDRAIDDATGVPAPERPPRRFDHDGSTLVIGERGQGELTFVLVHGIGMGRKVFGDLAVRLSRDARVLAVDLPGYGEAPEPPRTPTIERMADAVAALLRAEGATDAVLIGHSMGTQVVVEVAARHGLGSRVVLVGPTIDDSARRARTQLRRLAADLLDESPKVLLLGAREYLRARPHLIRKTRAMIVHRPEDAYPRVAVPALVVRGAEDPVSPEPWCRRVVAALPQGSYAEVPGHGHETMIKDAAPAHRLIREWLGR